MLDRKIQPELQAIDHIDFIAPKKYEINEHVFFYHMKDVPNETTRFDFYFDAGKYKGKGGIPSFVNGLILSGTLEKSSVQINADIDGLGGFLETGNSVENSVISMYCLKENLDSLFNILTDSIENVAFIDKEVDEYMADRKQDLKISMEKVRYLAQREFQKRLFSNNEMYNNTLEESDFEKVTLDLLKNFHMEHYLRGLSKVVVIGNISEDQIDKLIEICRPIAAKDISLSEKDLINEKGRFHVEKAGAIQSAIRIGRILFNKKHKDYLDFLVLNTILGDYFGSRLMSNIREDKGYTYGIGSAVVELNETGYFVIATEVGSDVRDAAISEIRKETERLQNELVSKEELELVKNYMLGQLLKSADGPYAMTDLFLSAEIHGMGLEFYNDALHSIRNITPERIQDLANKYLNWDDMTVVSAG